MSKLRALPFVGESGTVLSPMGCMNTANLIGGLRSWISFVFKCFMLSSDEVPHVEVTQIQPASPSPIFSPLTITGFLEDNSFIQVSVLRCGYITFLAF